MDELEYLEYLRGDRINLYLSFFEIHKSFQNRITILFWKATQAFLIASRSARRLQRSDNVGLIISRAYCKMS